MVRLVTALVAACSAQVAEPSGPAVDRCVGVQIGCEKLSMLQPPGIPAPPLAVRASISKELPGLLGFVGYCWQRSAY